MPAYIDISGKRFGRLVVLHRVDSPKFHMKKITYFLCKCDCGNNIITRSSAIQSNHTKSCGCYKSDIKRQQCKNIWTTHGMTQSKTYKTWAGIKRRCNNKNDKRYPDYGGRGIKVCSRWNRFENFLIDMGEKPTPNYSIERIDNNKGYNKNNCVWIPQNEQGNNKRNNVIFEFNGQIKTLAHWSKYLNINIGTLRNRILRQKWPIEKAFTTQIHTQYNKKIHL